MLENTEGAIKKGQCRETRNIGYKRRRKTKQKRNTICVGHHYMLGYHLPGMFLGRRSACLYKYTNFNKIKKILGNSIYI